MSATLGPLQASDVLRLAQPLENTDMTRTGRIASLAAVATVALVSLAACGGQDEQSRTTGAPDGPVQVRWIYDSTPTSAYLPS